MHVRTPRAAVAASGGGIDETAFAQLPRRHSRRPQAQAYWASRAFEVRSGRLVGFRIAEVTTPDGRPAARVEVALVAHGSDSLRWVNADGEHPILSESAARRWLQAETFTTRR
jgi:hypothetical protein